MPEPQMTIKLDSREFDEYYRKLIKALGSLKPLFKVVVPILRNTILANFRVGGRPRKWKSLSPFTVELRKRKRTWRSGVSLDQPILQEYGKLRASIGSVRTITDEYLEYGTNDYRAKVLQEGRGPISGTAHIKPFVRKQTYAWGRPIPPKKVTVRAHTRRFKFGPLPARPFILFQDSDVERISGYAATFAFDPERTKAVFG